MIRCINAFFVVGQAHNPIVPLRVWVAAAALSICAATVVAMQPGMLADLSLVRDWLAYWQSGHNPYPAFSDLDYPPGAFFVLWPLTLVTPAMAPFVLTPVLIVSCAIGALVLMRWFAERLDTTLRWQDQVILVAIMLAGGSLRGAIWRGQTTPIAFLFGALALYWARRRPWAATLALALAAFKPHLAIGFALAMLLTERRTVVVLTAGALALAQFLIFAATVQTSFISLLTQYQTNLIGLYDGPDRLIGMLSIRWVIELTVVHYWPATILWLMFAVGSLAFITSRVGRRLDSTTSTQVAAACLLWPLLFLPQQLYNGLLAAPAAWLLMWPESRLIARPMARTIIVSGFVLFGVLDLSRSIRLFSELLGDIYWLSITAQALAPLRLTLLFAFVLYRLAPRGGLEVAPSQIRAG